MEMVEIAKSNFWSTRSEGGLKPTIIVQSALPILERKARRAPGGCPVWTGRKAIEAPGLFTQIVLGLEIRAKSARSQTWQVSLDITENEMSGRRWESCAPDFFMAGPGIETSLSADSGVLTPIKTVGPCSCFYRHPLLPGPLLSRPVIYSNTYSNIGYMKWSLYNAGGMK
ncbi:hypothetical protein RRG08_014680 [Elysia crispata]|uniref:Uncharacterized protein n=1 Tax=Elysia crispata TaxID=231223 RepID=A0AAE1CZP2_9GAST|nr:hypothetical protein RRG08_014680 [Elysia crispata]